MELREYWQIIRRRWWLPVILTALVALLSALQLRPWQNRPPSYSAELRLLVGVMPAVNADTTNYDPRYYAWQVSEYLVDDFTEVVRSNLFAQNVNKRLSGEGVVTPPGLIHGSATTGKQHRILTLTIGGSDQAQLVTIANAATAELVENANFYFRQLGTENALVTLIDEPIIHTIGPNLRQRVEWPLRVLLAFAVGIGLLFLFDYLDTSVRHRQELENMGFVVIGEIPQQR